MEKIALSVSQKEVWTELLAWPNSSHLNIGGYTRIEGEIDIALFQRAINLMSREHDALRLVPTLKGEQYLLEQFDYQLVIKDFRNEPSPLETAKSWQQEWMSVPFTLNNEPPNRFALLQTEDQVQYFIVQCLHTVMDGWSTSLIVQKVGMYYSALNDQQTEFFNQDKPYFDFIQDSLKYRDTNAFQKANEFWTQALPTLPAPLFNKRYQGDTLGKVARANLDVCPVPRRFFEQLKQFSDGQKVSNFHCFLAMLAVYLCRSQSRQEIVIGVPTLNRSGGKYKNTLGMFVGVLPIKVICENHNSLLEIITQVSASLSQAYRYAKYPLSEHYKRLNPVKNGVDRIFDVLLSYEDFDFSCNYGQAKVTATRQTFSGRTRYPLAISVADFEQDIDGEMLLEGSEEYFSKNEILLIGKRIMSIGQQMLRDPDIKLNEIRLITEQEKQAQLDNLAINSIPESMPFINSFMKHANLTPHACALLWQNQVLTYQECKQAAFTLASQLQTLEIKQGQVVAFALERGPETVITMLACSIIGAVYLPLDVDIPFARLEYILEHSMASLLLVNVENKPRFTDLIKHTHILNIAELVNNSQSELDKNTSVISPVQLTGSDPAYILFTSGSTGQPKGVEVNHQALSNRLNWIAEHWQVTPQDRSLQATQINFDPALIEALVPLIKGGSVAFPTKGRLLPESLPQYVQQFEATMMAFVPSTLARFLEGIQEGQTLSLRICCCGGEVLNPELARTFVQKTGAQLFNVYGPTEATIFATSWSMSQEENAFNALPIGNPLSNTQIYILDEHRYLLPYGVVGEIYIGGEGLATKYIGDQSLTLEKFVENPFSAGTKLYATGDLGWLDTQGVLHFIGRNDRQVKLRGYRIELDEIEKALYKQHEVKEAAVKLVGEGEKSQIHAWVSMHMQFDVEEIRARLYQHLPDYMLPSAIYVLETMPFNSSGKIAYDQLIPCKQKKIENRARAPIGRLEKAILSIWQKALSNPELTVFDNFFFSGGDSLSAVISLTQLEQEIGKQLSLHQLVENPTVVKLAECIETELKLPKLMVSLGDSTRGISLYIAASGNGDVVRFKALAKAMDGKCDLHMLQPPKSNDLSITELAKLYADKIKSRNERNIYIAGFSVGGLAAIETANQLEKDGLTVNELFIVDTVLIRMPKLGFWLWQILIKVIKKLGRFDKYFLSAKLRSVICDHGLLLQVKAMNSHQIEPFSGSTSLLKSKALGIFQTILVKKWRKIFGPDLKEFKMETSHAGFFEVGKVEQLANILQSQINPDDKDVNS